MDIVERLRNTTGVHESLIYEAADEIERLREALQKIVSDVGSAYAEARSAIQQQGSK